MGKSLGDPPNTQQSKFNPNLGLDQTVGISLVMTYAFLLTDYKHRTNTLYEATLKKSFIK